MTSMAQSASVEPSSTNDSSAMPSVNSEPASTQQLWAFQPPKFEAVQCIPKKDREHIFSLSVLEASAVAHEPLVNGGNHWTFYLTVTPNHLDPDAWRLIQLDCTPSGTPAGGGGDGSKANIVISLLEDRQFSRAQCICRLTTRQPLKVSNFVDTIVEYGREKYDFDNKGQGCKKWVTEQMDLFLNVGIITDQDEVQSAKSEMMFQWEKFKHIDDHSMWAMGSYYQ
ncbi:hypothetical protein K4K58_001191 [Colletotrichum sp. SAR11_239]|nr:hypothetical protein K4K58_001191 [Colletotrichum sp. SAR11_239]